MPTAEHNGGMGLPTTEILAQLADDALRACGAAPAADGEHSARSPITGGVIGMRPAPVDTLQTPLGTLLPLSRQPPRAAIRARPPGVAPASNAAPT